LSLAPGRRLRTRLAGLFLFLPLLAQVRFDQLVVQASYPGSALVPACCALLSLLTLKLLDKERRSHIDDLNFDEAVGLFAGLNILRRNQAEAKRQAKREHKAPPTEEPTAPQQPEAKPVEPQPQPPSANGGNGPDRFAYLTPEQILEEIRKERLRIEAAWCDAPAPGQATHGTPTVRNVTEEKPVETREQPPSPIGENGPGQLLTRSVRTTTPAPSPGGGNGSGRYDHMSAEEILEEIRSGRYLLPPEEARRARQRGRQEQTGTDTNRDNGS
jgi:hypothetical protein